MKFIIFVFFITLSCFAQLSKMPSLPGIQELSKQVLEACKEDKSKITGCESYTEIPKLKACLMSNEAKLSPKCKASLKIVKQVLHPFLFKIPDGFSGFFSGSFDHFDYLLLFFLQPYNSY